MNMPARTRLPGDLEPGENSKFPSENVELLQSLIGQRICSLIHYSDEPLEEIESERVREDPFSWAFGPISLEVESGDIVGFADTSSKNSVTLWLEATAERYTRAEPMDSDPDFIPFRASDPLYRGSWGWIEGAAIKAIHLIKRAPRTVRYEHLPNEMGLRFTLDNGMEFIVSHGLHDDSEDFRVLTPDDILPEILPHLTEIDISKL